MAAVHSGAMVTHDTLLGFFHAELQPDRFRDYGPNGLQVQGRQDIRTIVSGVTASLALIEAAVALGADALLVHHGLFWRGQDGCVRGWMRERLKALLANDVNLYAYHLPLDAHPRLGNNAQLALRMGWLPAEEGQVVHFGEQDLGCLSEVAYDSAADLGAHLRDRLGRQPVVVDGAGRSIRRLAWCTGGAQSYFEAAIAAGADAFVTGEISEPQAHYARECGVAYLACGHHASERYGAAALGAHAAATWGLTHHFIDMDNPA